MAILIIITLDDDEDNNNSNNNQRIKEVLVDFVMKHADNDDHHSDQNSSNSSDAGSDHDKKNTQRSKQQPPNASKKSDPWVEVTDEFGRTRIVRQSAAEKIAMRGFVKGDDNGTGSSSSAVPHSMMSQDMLREQERLEWEANALKEISGKPNDQTK